jgi:hypothetical protein
MVKNEVFGLFSYLTISFIMKKLYVFLVVAVLAVCLGTSASAQSYTASDYTVRVHGDSYVPLSDPTTIYTSTGPYEYYYMPSGMPEMTIPFSINYFGTVTNKIKAHVGGDIIVAADASWSNLPNGWGTQQYVYASGFYPQPFSVSTGSTPRNCPAYVNTSYVNGTGAYYYSGLASAPYMYDGGSYGYIYSYRNLIRPWWRYNAYTGDWWTGQGPYPSIQTQTIGTAPNRRFVVQFINVNVSLYRHCI